MDADHMFREAIYQAFQEIEADPRLNHADEVNRLISMVESLYWQLVNDYTPDEEEGIEE